jgi:hypothetical protein
MLFHPLPGLSLVVAPDRSDPRIDIQLTRPVRLNLLNCGHLGGGFNSKLANLHRCALLISDPSFSSEMRIRAVWGVYPVPAQSPTAQHSFRKPGDNAAKRGAPDAW